ncbi:DUF2177 family protein [Sulfitobacter sabulilitoris]|uniref:DUF2177 family protein n=1 Tax=Sulfitobacter sabulilitoris TaxID=2562655 RepID=A0A5S3PJQ1_9RHOB|nr:DUF2177 family protein [Sulfitobacter sabulilitoris]TMM54531.1 DUF2177 family protein [Sulfitobacter sabulilitoris]
MRLAILYALTFALFLGFDYLGLSYIVRPAFEQAIAPLLLEELRIGPALVFYAFYIAGLLWFVSVPGLRDDRGIGWVAGNAALLGAMAYGTYEFTNLATLKDWTWVLVLTDLTWGTALTATSASLGVWITRRLA